MITLVEEVPIFQCFIAFAGDCLAEEAENYFYDYDNLRSKIEFTEGSNGGVREWGGNVYVWCKDLNNAGIMSHELGHAACSIMHLSNTALCAETEEVMCYLLGWLERNVAAQVYKIKREEAVKEVDQ